MPEGSPLFVIRRGCWEVLGADKAAGWGSEESTPQPEGSCSGGCGSEWLPPPRGEPLWSPFYLIARGIWLWQRTSFAPFAFPEQGAPRAGPGTGTGAPRRVTKVTFLNLADTFQKFT